MSDDNTTAATPDPEGPSGPTEERRTPRWVKVCLTISLAINLLIVGLAGAMAFKHFSGKGFGGGQLGHVMMETRRFVRDLPRERRHELRDLLRAHRDEFREERQHVEEGIRDLAEVLGSEDFSEDSLTEALEQLEERAGGIVHRGGEVLAELLLSLTEEERLKLSERMLRRLD